MILKILCFGVIISAIIALLAFIASLFCKHREAPNDFYIRNPTGLKCVCGGPFIPASFGDPASFMCLRCKLPAMKGRTINKI